MKISAFALVAAVLAAPAYTAEVGFDEQLNVVVKEAHKAADEARKEISRAPAEPLSPLKTYAGCSFQSTDPLEIVVFHTKESAAQAGVFIKQTAPDTVRFAVEAKDPGSIGITREPRLLRLRQPGGRRIFDILISDSDLRLGEAAKDTPESFKMDTSIGGGLGGIGLSGEMSWQFTDSFSWGFLGLGGSTRLAVHCKVPLDINAQ